MKRLIFCGTPDCLGAINYTAKMDEIGRSDDVSERSVFGKDWEIMRARVECVRAGLLDARSLVATIDELLQYIEGTQPWLSEPWGVVGG
jgi:hypothetical protein